MHHLKDRQPPSDVSCGRRRRRGLCLVAVATAVALALVGCSSSGSGSSQESGGKVTLRVVSTTPEGTPYSVVNHGNDLGAWKSEGINVKIIAGTPVTAATLMASGGADISIGSAVTDVGNIVQGLKAKIIAAQDLPWGQDLIVSAKSGITEASQLKGATIGVSGFTSGGYYATLKMTRYFHWSPSDYKLTQLGDVNGLSAALKSGAIKAFIWNPTQGAILEQQGVGKDLGPVSKFVGATVSDAFAATDSVLQQHPDAVKAFLDGYYKTVVKMQQDPTPILNVLVQKEKADKSAVEPVYKEEVSSWSTDGSIPKANVDGLAQAAKIVNPQIGSFDINSMIQDWHSLK